MQRPGNVVRGIRARPSQYRSEAKKKKYKNLELPTEPIDVSSSQRWIECARNTSDYTSLLR